MPTPIEWVKNPDGTQGETINVFRAINKATGKRGHFCIKLSPGCRNCYASGMQKPWFTQLDFVATNRDKIELFFDEKALMSVIRRKKPTAYFWHDMSDMYWDGYPDEWIDRCVAAMALTPHHTHMVLTKRADRMRAYIADRSRSDGIDVRIYKHMRYGRLEPRNPLPKWPLPNVWLGVSVENQQYADERIPHLLQTPAALRFISAEPLLGPVDLEHLPSVSGIGRYLNALNAACIQGSDILGSLDWIIAGYESGRNARAGHPQWARTLRDQTVGAGKKFHFKQWGEWCPAPEDTPLPQSGFISIEGGSTLPSPGGGFSYGPTELKNRGCEFVARFGKKAAGAMLDGREWREMPERGGLHA